jgi:hypothetical protein
VTFIIAPFSSLEYSAFTENSGYNGANYDFYIEAANGKWSQYLYELSSTGTRALKY